MLHSLVPAFSQIARDGRYGLMDEPGSVELIIVDQDLDKDRHIWEKALGKMDERIGPLDFLLQVLSTTPYRLISAIREPRCYEHLVWGHEIMLYSGGGWTNSTHVHAFAAASKALVGAPVVGPDPSGRHLLLVERKNASAWGRWIDNFPAVYELAQRWAEGNHCPETNPKPQARKTSSIRYLHNRLTTLRLPLGSWTISFSSV